ncbi:MAG TPA: hypothetical protein PLM07_15320 [Candidatus Rifleibacterium sp.]|nr:hypothetical protein [Candidatus Rifleibacterium sp.]HPT47250.1 hypothetical protein [Candidatus Rifleibacterium sp.]
MRWQNLLLVSFLAACLSGAIPEPLHAQALDQLIDAAGGSLPDVPRVPDPTPVDQGSSDNSSGSDYNSGSSDNSSYDNSSYDNSSSSNSSSDSGSSNYSSDSGSSDTSSYSGSTSYSGSDNSSDNNSGGGIFWGLFNPKPVDPVYEQQQREKRQKIREERKKKREKAAQKRRDARADREYERLQKQKKKRQADEAAKAPTGYVAPVPPPRALPPSMKPPTADVPAGSEAKALSENQFRMATLLKKGNLSAPEQELLRQLHSVCRTLWARAVQNEALTAIERSRIKLSIPAVDFAEPTIATRLSEQVNQIRSSLNGEGAPNIDLIKKFNKEKFQQLAEQEAGELAENLVEGGQGTFDNLLGAAKVSAAVGQGDIAAAGKETLDFLVGRLSSPQASMAVEGGRLYASTTFAALDNFMVKAMGATGNDFNTREFWEQVKSEMTIGQKTVFEFIGGHDGK